MMKIDEPIEIRFEDHRGEENYVLIAHARDGLVITSLQGLTGQPQSMSNLQAKGTYPRKAVRGWQDELVAYVRTGLYSVSEIR